MDSSTMQDRAVAAMRAHLTTGPDTPRSEAEDRTRRAAQAVTAAVTGGHCLHSQIASLAGCSGLRVVELITDWSAQADALRREEHQARLYVEQVGAAMRGHVVRRHGEQGRGAVMQMHRELGYSRPTLYGWISAAREDVQRELDNI